MFRISRTCFWSNKWWKRNVLETKRIQVYWNSRNPHPKNTRVTTLFVSWKIPGTVDIKHSSKVADTCLRLKLLNRNVSRQMVLLINDTTWRLFYVVYQIFFHTIQYFMESIPYGTIKIVKYLPMVVWWNLKAGSEIYIIFFLESISWILQLWHMEHFNKFLRVIDQRITWSSLNLLGFVKHMMGFWYMIRTSEEGLKQELWEKKNEILLISRNSNIYSHIRLLDRSWS